MVVRIKPAVGPGSSRWDIGTRQGLGEPPPAARTSSPSVARGTPPQPMMIRGNAQRSLPRYLLNPEPEINPVEEDRR